MQNKRKKRVLILGSTGMLGSMTYSILKDKYDLTISYKNEEKLKVLFQKYGKNSNIKAKKLDLKKEYEKYVQSSGNIIETLNNFEDVDFVLNCLGMIKDSVSKFPELTLFVNGVFPHILSNYYQDKLIHVSTDCVFSGFTKGPYYENFLPDSKDLYGITKAAGEPSRQSLVLRTSFIGPELQGKKSLFSWLLSQKGSTKGYIDHHWNGLTTKEMAKVFIKIIENRKKFPKNGLFHVYSSDITKYDLLNLVKDKYLLDVEIEPILAGFVDHRLRTKYIVNRQLKIPHIKYQIKDL